MRMLTTMFVLALLALPTWAKDEASPPLQEGEALRLLQEAAQISPAYMRTLIAIDRKTARKVVYTQGSDAPLTAAILALAEGGELEAQDFRWLEHATPAEFIAAIHPLDPMQPGSRPKHATANVLHRELVRVLTVTSDGARARGTIEFGKDHIFKGFAHWQAARDRAGRWQVTEIAFRRSHVRVVRVGTRWRLDATGLRSRINRRRGFDLQLPRIGTVGVEPPKDQTILISVTQAAYVHVGDDTTKLSMEALRAVLARRAAPDATREEDGSCKLAVLLDIDASTPWAFVQWIMQTCAHPAVKIHKLYFGVRAASDGAEGTVAVRLPKDRSGPILTTPPPPKIKVKTFFAEREPSDPRALFAALRKVPLAERQAALWELAAPPPHGGKVPHGYILQLLDAMITAGATNIMFEGAAPPLRGAIWSDPEAMAAHIRDLKAIPGHAYVKLGKERLGQDAPTHDMLQLGRIERTLGAPAFDERNPRAGLIFHEDVVLFDERPELAPPDLSELKDPPRPEGGIRDAPIADKVTDMDHRRRRAVRAGLRWLAAHQTPSGGWTAAAFGATCDGEPRPAGSPKATGAGLAIHDVGISGLAVSAFLAAGYTNRGKHPYAKVVGRGLRYLKNVQDPEGCFGPRTTPQYVYHHATAALAMVSAYRRTGSPLFKGSAQRALDYIATCRNPQLAWRYGIKPGDNDTSVTAWMVRVIDQARRANQRALDRGKPAPLVLDSNMAAGVQRWLDRMTDPATGRIGYIQRGGPSSRPAKRLAAFPSARTEATTAAGLSTRLLLGADPHKDPLLRRGMQLLLARPPTWNPKDGSIDLAYWLWGTRAALPFGGTIWTAWRDARDRALTGSQITTGDPCLHAGSWDPVGVWGREGGRAYATAMACLTLVVDYRFITIKPK